VKPFNDPLLTNVVLSANKASAAIPLPQMFGYAVQAVISGTPTGTLKLQASVDPVQEGVPNPPLPTNWNDIASSSVTVTAAGTTTWNVTDAMYTWVRLVYTDASSGSSTAVINANINGKGI
jgi:hypothetical protein